MQLNTARNAWHDAFYAPWDSVMAYALELARLGNSVQLSERDTRTARVVHQTLAGRVQQAIDTLPGYVRAFGHWLYCPLADDDHREVAENAVFLFAYDRMGRMTDRKVGRARYVAKGVLYRYRRMHQGGQSACPDPLASPEAFRAWLFGEYGIRLASESWGRDWQPFVQACFDVCNDLDKQALAPVARLLSEMKQVA